MGNEETKNESTAPEVATEPEVTPEKEATPSSGDKIKVLVVEDDKFLRELLVRKLEVEGMDTVTAVDGNEALEKMAAELPKIVLLDLILPGIDGFDVLKKMKEDQNIAKIPVIILSNLGQKEEVEKGLKLGADDYMIKAHFTPDEIVEKVKKILKDSYL